MGEFGVVSESDVVAGVGVGASGIGGCDGMMDPVKPSASSIFNTSGTVPTMGSATTFDSSSCRSSDLDYLQPGSSADGFVEVDIGGVVGGSGMVSPPPHLSMSFGSWNTSSSEGRGSGRSERSSGANPGTDPGPISNDGGHGGEEDEGRRRLLRPRQHPGYTTDNHTTATLVQTEIVREDVRSHLRKKSGSPVSWASPARGTLFIVNPRNSEDL